MIIISMCNLEGVNVNKEIVLHFTLACVKRQPTDKGIEFLEIRVNVYLWADFSRKIGTNH